MANDGLDLARPPITVWRARAASVLAVRMAGANLYSMGAGGFARVPSMPQLQRLTTSANPNSDANMRMVELYAQQPAMFKKRLQAQFNPPSAP